MDLQTLGQRLATLRSLRGLTQKALAALVGVSQGQYCHWERETQPVPAKYLSALAAALAVDVRNLEEVHAIVSQAPRTLPVFLTRRRRCSLQLPAFEVKGTVDQMLDFGDYAVDVYEAVARLLSLAQVAYVEQKFPHESPLELLATYGLLALGARLDRMTLAQVRCPVLAVEEYGSTRNAVYHLRDVLVLERPGVALVLYPQVWVVSVLQAEWYRLDFLCYVQGQGGGERWGDLEVDGRRGHEARAEYDQRRARGIGVPRIGFWTQEVNRADFGARAVARLAALLEVQPQRFLRPLPNTGQRARSA